MDTTLRINYDTAGIECSAIPVNAELPFSDYLEDMADITSESKDRERISGIAEEDRVYARAEKLADFLSISMNPCRDILYIMSLAVQGDRAGVRLLFSLLAAEPSPSRVISEYSNFGNLKRLMKDIERRAEGDTKLTERELLFIKKIDILPLSHPLPGGTDGQGAWRNWEKEVRRGLADPDDRWDNALRERILVELEACLIRINRIMSGIDPELHANTITELINVSDEITWTVKSLKRPGDRSSESSLLIRKSLSAQWDYIRDSLESSAAGRLVNRMFSFQESKVHSYPRVKSGTAVLMAILRHPQISSRMPDILSCLYLFMESSGEDRIEFVFPSSRIDSSLFGVQGFRIRDNVLTVELREVPNGLFLDEEGLPSEFNWAEVVEEGAGGDYKFLILSNLDNSTFLKHILENPKFSSKPGVVSLISLKCKSSDVLTKIASRRELYTGFANKDVPKNLLMNPARVPVTALRKFIHVRYIDKMSLRQMASKRGKGGQIREEIRREIEKYLDSQ